MGYTPNFSVLILVPKFDVNLNFKTIPGTLEAIDHSLGQRHLEL